MKGITRLSLSGLILIAAAFIAAPVTAHDHSADLEPNASDRGDDHRDFLSLMQAVDIIPDADAMKERWPDVAERLIRLAENEDASRYERMRATSLLANFVEPATRQALLRLTGDSEVRIRSLAYYTLGKSFLRAGDDALFAHVEAGLRDDEERVRADVVRAFGWTDHEKSLEILREIATDEEDRRMQRLAERSLDRRGR